MKLLLLLLFTFPSLSAFGQTPLKDEDLSSEQWVYQVVTDEMTDEVNKSAILRSINAVNLSFPYNGDTHAYIHVSGNAKAIIVVEKGQIPYGLDEVLIRFDDDKAYKLRIYTSTSSAFLLPKSVVKKFAKHNLLKIEVPFYEDGKHIFNFNVNGLDLNKIKN